MERVEDRIPFCVLQHEILPVGVPPDCLMALSDREAESGWRSVSSDGKDFASSVSNDHSYLAVRIVAALTDFIA
jgi:hypothetical protein